VRVEEFDQRMERLILHFTGPGYSAPSEGAALSEVAEAKKEFFTDAGIMDERSDHFEMRMVQFLDWYLFTRPLQREGKTPARLALEIDQFVMTAQERLDFEALSETKHSLFEFLKLRGRDIHIRDLFLDKEIIVRDSPVNLGFTREEIFDARLVPVGEEHFFARGFCFHPADASKFIRDEIAKLPDWPAHEDKELLMLRLMKMRYKYEQFRHLRLDMIYSNEKKVRF